MRALALLGAALALVACDKKPAASSGPSQAKLEQVSEALASAGFKTDGLQSTDPSKFSAQKCTAGTLEGIETMLCEYGSAEAVALGKKAGDAWLAQAPTGAVLDNGLTILAVADRNRGDPNGKTIHRITQAFLHAR